MKVICRNEIRLMEEKLIADGKELVIYFVIYQIKLS